MRRWNLKICKDIVSGTLAVSRVPEPYENGRRKMDRIEQTEVTLLSQMERNCFSVHQEQVHRLIRRKNNMRASVTLCLCVFVLSATAVAQTRPIPRIADGHPDFQGIWSFATITPLERPAELAGKEFFASDKEAADYEADVRRRNNMDRRDGPAEQDVGRAYNDFWYDRGTKVAKTRRTSLIIEPHDGKVPPLTPAGRERQTERLAVNRGHEFDGPENRPLAERCIIWP